MREAYVTMVYGPTDASSLWGLHVLLESIRGQEVADGDGVRREVLVLRLLDDDDSPALDQACRRYAPARIHRVARLTLDPSVHHECARHLRVWAGSGGSSRTSSAAAGAQQERQQHSRHELPLPLRSIFSVFAVWSLADYGYTRVLWVETDQFVMGSLAELWRMPLADGVLAAAVPVGTVGCRATSVGPRAAKYNTGVVLLRPNMSVYASLVTMLSRRKEAVAVDVSAVSAVGSGGSTGGGVGGGGEGGGGEAESGAPTVVAAAGAPAGEGGCNVSAGVVGASRASSSSSTGINCTLPHASTWQWPVPVGRSYRHLRHVTCTDGSQTMWNMVLAHRVICLDRSYNSLSGVRPVPLRPDSAPPAPPCVTSPTKVPQRLKQHGPHEAFAYHGAQPVHPAAATHIAP